MAIFTSCDHNTITIRWAASDHQLPDQEAKTSKETQVGHNWHEYSKSFTTTDCASLGVSILCNERYGNNDIQTTTYAKKLYTKKLIFCEYCRKNPNSEIVLKF